MPRKKPVTNDLTDKEKLDIVHSKDVAKKMKRRTVSKWVALLLLIALFVTGSVWGVLSLVDYNSMKVLIDKESTGIALSEDKAFTKPATNITVKGPSRMKDITYTDIDWESEVLNKEGSHPSEKGYIAYTVFLKNVADYKSLKYVTRLTIPKHDKGMQKAIRIMVLTTRYDSEGKELAPDVKIYAQKKEDGTPEHIAYDSDQLDVQRPIPLDKLNLGSAVKLQDNVTTPFVEKREEYTKDETFYVDLILGQDLNGGEIVKYTVVMWFEGSDAQCVDNILGGYCVVRLEFGVEEYGDAKPIG